jgi:hypothetical protein
MGIRIAIAALCMAAASTAFASKPTSITFVAEEADFATYVVKCSDGTEQKLTAWDQRKKWCVGEASQDDCDKKQIRAAKAACK